jgi:hypothetical protein
MENRISADRLAEWAETCLRINHLNTLVQREIESGNLARAAELSERARARAWKLFNDMLQAGARKPVDYCEPDEEGDDDNSLTNER